MDENEIIDYVNKSKQYTAFEVTPTSRDFEVGESWGFDISKYSDWSESEIYDKGDMVKHGGAIYVAIEYSGEFTNEWNTTYHSVEPGTNSSVWK